MSRNILLKGNFQGLGYLSPLSYLISDPSVIPFSWRKQDWLLTGDAKSYNQFANLQNLQKKIPIGNWNNPPTTTERKPIQEHPEPLSDTLRRPPGEKETKYVKNKTTRSTWWPQVMRTHSIYERSMLTHLFCNNRYDTSDIPDMLHEYS